MPPLRLDRSRQRLRRRSFRGLRELDCLQCHERVGVVVYPTIEESRAHCNALDPAHQQQIEIIGGVLDLDFMGLHQEAKLIAIDE